MEVSTQLDNQAPDNRLCVSRGPSFDMWNVAQGAVAGVS